MTFAARPIERSESLSARVYSEIERMILTGDILPGSRINEAVLAGQMAVSRAPVREATRALVEAGLLISIPARGVFVREMSHREIAENYDVRSLLTGLMCARAAERRTEAEAAKLKRLITDMDTAIAAGRIVRYYEINLAFHELIGRIADHSCARRVYNDLIRETHVLRRSLSSPEQTNLEHHSIAEAIERGDVELARQRGLEHVLNGKARWKASIENAVAAVAAI
ncbi:MULTISPECIES: GntR family transcriptional regulator [unclassified Mesorhizobium]|uniref:GntR family transcriptional regulator n=1 Tax=unclassified Mesorhizobium TaxID=325217 RepID=UPI000FD1CF25|nr:MULTISPECIES: GntR family transcriptional regulator [unclassified Mesorhizobium]RVB77460.1 FCD domain-containing protein [Mesorhizobium sp. M6A.T.Cr.TU.014.01.1.1]RWP71479.1 MAG: FCD domain-containing protein [Mesorhizobium sp.]RWQ01944.1 MAG: FCD domain-containing protein [Mesorhizobium sp.]RWQ03059.1 MAG: FCD domain-containing protein [Mesorhizobium sp.]